MSGAAGGVSWSTRRFRRERFRYFFRDIPRDAAILEVGCGEMWLKPMLLAGGWKRYVGLDVRPPADVVADIRDWRRAGLTPASFDVVVAFEVLEHVDCADAIRALLRPGGWLFATTPVPSLDWVCRLLEGLGVNQKRTSPHTHLMDLRAVRGFEVVAYRRVMAISQWGKLRRPLEAGERTHT